MDEKEAELKAVKAENKKLLSAARAYQNLSACYRIGKRPTEKLFSQLEKANALLKQKGGKVMECECGVAWAVQENLSAYEGEIVLVCLKCGSRYFNAQEYFDDDKLANLDRVEIKR